MSNKKRLFLLGKNVIFLITCLLGLLASLLLSSVLPDNISTPIAIFLSGVFDFAVCISIVIFFIRVIDKDTISLKRFSIRNTNELLIGSLLGAVSIIIGFLIIIQLKWDLIEILPLRITYLFSSFLMLAFGAFLEEIIFRGYILRKLSGEFSAFTALLLSSVLFMLAHIFNASISFFPLLNIFLAGILLGLLYLITRNIWMVAGFHLFWNYTQSLLGFDVSGQGLPSVFTLNFPEMNSLNGGEFGFEGSYICSAILTIGTISAAYLLKKRNSYDMNLKQDN